MTKKDLIKKILELGKELEKANGFDAVMIINNMEIEVDNYTKKLTIPAVVVEPPKINSKDFKDWLKSEGYKNKGFGIYQKENKDCCYQLLYKHYCKIQELGN